MVDVNNANKEALERVLSARPMLVGMGKAGEVIPEMGERMLLHAGPPIEWERMSGPLKGAIIGAMLYEGWASTPEEAEKMASKGEIEFDPCHHHHAVGPMAGVISPSMPVFIVENKTFNNKAYVTQNEGLGKVLRYGAYSQEVIDRLRWMEKVLYPVLNAGIKRAYDSDNAIDLKNLIAQALHMGDELHNRNKRQPHRCFCAPFSHTWLRAATTTRL